MEGVRDVGCYGVEVGREEGASIAGAQVGVYVCAAGGETDGLLFDGEGVGLEVGCEPVAEGCFGVG